MAKCLLVGDLHGNFQNLLALEKSVIEQGIDIDFVIQCGDFGFYPHHFKKMSWLPIPTIAIAGNHCNHEWLSEQDHNKWELDYNLFYQPVGKIENDFHGSIIAFMGKALNVDRANSGSIDKRTTNYLLDVEVNEFLEKVKNYPRIDLLVTHSCPHSVGIGMVGNPIFFETIEKFCHEKGHSTGRINDCGDGALSKLYRGLASLNLLPRHWIFGHFHQYKMKTIRNTDFWCIGCGDSSDGKPIKNPFVYDTNTKMVNWYNEIFLKNI